MKKSKFNTFYTADTHFGHTNLIKNRHRPFEFTVEMNETIVQRWNLVVGPNDVVWHLGDVFFRDHSMLDELKGRKYLILGNHDIKNKRILERYFAISDQIVLDKQNKLVLSHYPIHSWAYKRYGWIHLHGHSHGTMFYDQNAMDVGVDCWEFVPVTLNLIREKMLIRQLSEHEKIPD